MCREHGKKCDFENEVSFARFAGTPHRKCKNCNDITLDLGEEDDDFDFADLKPETIVVDAETWDWLNEMLEDDE